jgi:hypothetical protein
MTFKERYDIESTWQGRVQVMEIYHLAMCQRIKNWTLTMTAEHFRCSIGLVSENLRLALALHTNSAMLRCESRQDALKQLGGK